MSSWAILGNVKIRKQVFPDNPVTGDFYYDAATYDVFIFNGDKWVLAQDYAIDESEIDTSFSFEGFDV